MLELLKEYTADYSFAKGLEFKNIMPYADPDDLILNRPLSDWGLPNSSFGYFLWIQFHHNKRKNPYPIYKNIDGGYLYCTNSTTVYFSPNNLIYKLSCTHSPHDWEMHNRLYEVTNKHNIIIEEPVHGESLDFLNQHFWYTIVKRPNMTDLVDPHQIHIEGNATKDLLLKLFDETYKYCSVIKELDKKYELGCPNQGALICKFQSYPDQEFKGVWTDIKHWKYSFTDYINYTFEDKKDYLLNFKNPNITDSDSVELLNKLKDNFQQLGVTV